MPKASILLYLKHILIKVKKRQCGLNWQLKHNWSFLGNPGDAAALLRGITWELSPQAEGNWSNPEDKDW